MRTSEGSPSKMPTSCRSGGGSFVNVALQRSWQKSAVVLQVIAEFRRKWRLVAKKAGVPDNVNNRDSFPAGMILGGPDRARISQTMTLKRIDYSLRMQRRV
jgi:hypothetical protein